MRIATYNVEWFYRLFDKNGRLLEDDRWSARRDVTRAQQLQALGRVFQALDADGVMVIEAPDAGEWRDGVKALEAFAARFGLRTRKALMGFVNDTRQEIAFLYDPDRIEARHAPQSSGTAPRFDQPYSGDGQLTHPVTWSKPPLELALRPRHGPQIQMIGVHAKSKAPHGAETPEEIRKLSIANRRKQIVQMHWLRQRIDAHLTAGDPLIVLGDFNDGPGLDEYEALFGQSSVEIALGQGAQPRLSEPHATLALSQRVGVQPTTARFYFAPEKRYMQALLDYVMLSPDLAKGAQWRIWHPFDDPQIWHDTALRDAILTASDHFPVSVDLRFGD